MIASAGEECNGFSLLCRLFPDKKTAPLAGADKQLIIQSRRNAGKRGIEGRKRIPKAVGSEFPP